MVIPLALLIGCQEPNPVFTNIVGITKDTLTMEGIDSIIVILRDIDPVDRVNWRLRKDTTENEGWFRFDSVCYGDENSVTYIIIGVDSSDNKKYQTRQYNVTVSGPIDTVPTIWLVRK